MDCTRPALSRFEIFIEEVTIMSINTSRIDLINEFEHAPESTLFGQRTLAAVLDCSTHLLEKNRWVGCGIPFLKIGRTVRYRKKDVLEYLAGQQTYHSTSEII